MLSFPQSSSGRPWARLDARTGLMFISSPEGDKLPVDLKGKALGFALSPESARELARQLLAKAGEP